MRDFIKKLFIPWLSVLKRPWVVICVSIIGMLYGAINNGFTKFFFAIPFAVLFIHQIRNVNRKVASMLFVAVVVICGYLAWDLPHSRLLYPVLGEEISFNGGVWATKLNDHPSGDRFYNYTPWLVSMDMFAERVCSMNYRAVKQCENTQEFIDRIQKEGDTSYKPFNQTHLKIEMIGSTWNEANGTTLIVYLVDSSGARYYMGEKELMDAVKRGIIISDELLKKDGVVSCWGVQSCWSRW